MKLNIISICVFILFSTLTSCKTKSEMWYEMYKNKTLTLNDYIKEFGEPINVKKEKNRTYYEFFGEENSKECNNNRDFVGTISFEIPRKYEGNCVTNIKLVTESKKNIEGWITKWVFGTNDLTGKNIGKIEFNSDKTYIYSTSILGGFGSKGTWKIYNGYNVGEANVVLYPPEEQVKSGNVPSEIYLTVYEEGYKIKNDNTVYLPIK